MSSTFLNSSLQILLLLGGTLDKLVNFFNAVVNLFKIMGYNNNINTCKMYRMVKRIITAHLMLGANGSSSSCLSSSLPLHQRSLGGGETLPERFIVPLLLVVRMNLYLEILDFTVYPKR